VSEPSFRNRVFAKLETHNISLAYISLLADDIAALHEAEAAKREAEAVSSAAIQFERHYQDVIAAKVAAAVRPWREVAQEAKEFGVNLQQWWNDTRINRRVTPNEACEMAGKVAELTVIAARALLAQVPR